MRPVPAPRPGRVRARGDDGAALLEFALVIGPLLFLVLGALSLGILLATRHAMDEAAGEAARAGALAWDDPGTVGADERVEAALDALAAQGTIGDRCTEDPALDCDVEVVVCPDEPTLQCLDLTLTLDRSVDPVVGQLPLVESVLPDRLVSHATAVVNDAS